ncbi:uncharacterized protein [Eleutherodactylus coqui]|uniref:uncharacterized protein n=1 Tax=Eleutherodactylus coqui TaxID=57060 RepID=UPI0034618BAE
MQLVSPDPAEEDSSLRKRDCCGDQRISLIVAMEMGTPAPEGTLKWRPVMGEIEKSAFKDGKEAKLLCRISGYFPDALDVKWLRRDAEGQEWFDVSADDKYKIPVMEATQQEDKTFTYTACLYLTVSAATDSGAEFICRVKHPSLRTPLERSSGELGVIGIRAVKVTPLSEDKVRVEVLHYTPKDIRVTWRRKTTVLKLYEDYKAAALIIETNSDGTFTAYSEITSKEQTTYKVLVEHDASDSVVEKTVLHEKDGWYLVENKDSKTLLHQIPEQQQHDRNVNAENRELPAGVFHTGYKVITTKTACMVSNRFFQATKHCSCGRSTVGIPQRMGILQTGDLVVNLQIQHPFPLPY